MDARPRPEAGFDGRLLWSSMVDVAGRSDWQSPLYLAFAPLAFLKPTNAQGGVLAVGVSLVRLRDLVAVDAPARSILAADAPRRGGAGRLGGRLVGVVEGLADHPRWNTRAGDHDQPRLFLDRARGAQRMDRRRRVPPPRHPAPAQPSPGRDRRPAAGRRQDPPRRSGGRVPPRPSDPLQHGLQPRDDRDARGRPPPRGGPPHPPRSRNHARLRRLEGDRSASPPAGYGFTDYVTPERFAAWIAAGILGPPTAMGMEQDLYEVH